MEEATPAKDLHIGFWSLENNDALSDKDPDLSKDIIF